MSRLDDLISRQAAITAIQNAYCDTEGGEDKCAVWKNVGLTNALHIMQDLPSAQPDAVLVVQGEWIDEDYYSQDKQHKVYRCSKCGWHMVSRPTELFNYCPSCGAKQSWVKDETES